MLRTTTFLAFGALAFIAFDTPDAYAQSGVSVGLEQAVASTPKEQLAYAQEALEEMQGSVRSVEKLYSSAEKEGDLDTIQCLRNKLAAIRALYEVSQGAQVDMQESLASGDADRAQHEFRKVSVAVTKVRQFVAEAEACMGDRGAQPGTTDVEVTIEGVTEADEVEEIEMDVFESEEVGSDPPATSPFD